MNDDTNYMNDDLLVKHLLNECNEQEVATVDNWLKASPENQLYYQQFKQIWDESKSLSLATEVDTDEAWLRMKARMSPPKKGLSVTRTLFYMAAAVLLLFGSFSLYKRLHQERMHEPQPISVITDTIESNLSTRIDTLSDHSIVTLNKHAMLHYPKVFAGNERRVKLKGEAFFNIAPDKEKPFFIEATNNVEIRVVGTSFNVKAFDKYTEVVVETGIVQVKKFNKVILLHPNERARIDKEDSSIVVMKSKDKLYKYYRSKEFECDNTPLWKVVEVLNEAYGDSIIIGRDELKSLTLTTRFDNESLESILDVISETFEINVEKKGNKYILK